MKDRVAIRAALFLSARNIGGSSVGHAWYGNLCDLFVDLLYAKGKLSVCQASEVAGRRGEKLQTSEADYDADSGMVSQAIGEYCDFLSVDDANDARHRWGFEERWEGPFIEPIFDPMDLIPKALVGNRDLSALLRNCSDNPHNGTNHQIAGDALRERGYDELATYVADLLKLRSAYNSIKSPQFNISGEDWWQLTDRVLWRFCKGKRSKYRDIPRLGSVTH